MIAISILGYDSERAAEISRSLLGAAETLGLSDIDLLIRADDCDTDDCDHVAGGCFADDFASVEDDALDRGVMAQTMVHLPTSESGELVTCPTCDRAFDESTPAAVFVSDHGRCVTCHSTRQADS